MQNIFSVQLNQVLKQVLYSSGRCYYDMSCCPISALGYCKMEKTSELRWTNPFWIYGKIVAKVRLFFDFVKWNTTLLQWPFCMASSPMTLQYTDQSSGHDVSSHNEHQFCPVTTPAKLFKWDKCVLDNVDKRRTAALLCAMESKTEKNKYTWNHRWLEDTDNLLCFKSQ